MLTFFNFTFNKILKHLSGWPDHDYMSFHFYWVRDKSMSNLRRKQNLSTKDYLVYSLTTYGVLYDWTRC